MLGLGGNHRSRLDARRSGTDHADALARKVDALVRPLPCMVPVTLERLQPRNGGHVGSGQAADGGDEKFCDEGLARFCTDMPAIGRFVVVRRRNAGPQIECRVSGRTCRPRNSDSAEFPPGPDSVRTIPILASTRGKMYTSRHDFQSRTVHQGSDSRTTYPRYHQPLPAPLLSSQADHAVGTTGKGLQSLHQSPTRLAQLVGSFFRSRNSTSRHPFRLRRSTNNLNTIVPTAPKRFS